MDAYLYDGLCVLEVPLISEWSCLRLHFPSSRYLESYGESVVQCKLFPLNLNPIGSIFIKS